MIRVINFDKTNIEYILNYYKVKVEFMKKDGSLRVMNCTRNFDIMKEVTGLDESVNIKGTNSENKEVVKVFDLDKQEWRSFRVDSVQLIEIYRT